jgi:hypothetical protein
MCYVLGIGYFGMGDWLEVSLDNFVGNLLRIGAHSTRHGQFS